MLPVNPRIRELPTVAAADEPTVGSIKQVFHKLSRRNPSTSQRDGSASLRDAHEQLRQLAISSGIDPDEAVKRSLAAVALLRERMARTGASLRSRQR